MLKQPFMHSSEFENNFNGLQKRNDYESDEEEFGFGEREEPEESEYESIYVKIGKEVKQELFRGSREHYKRFVDSKLETSSIH